jgi:SnoaL-like domain/Sigma-70, region 4
VLILRDVLGFSAREVAESLKTTVASVNSSMQRARKTVDERLPARSQQETLRELGDTRLRELVRKYVAAWESRDIDAMVAMLVDGATFAMPPHPHWYHGREAVIAFLAGTGQPDLRHILTRANGQSAVGWYLWDPPSERYRPASLEVLALERDRVSEITAFTGRMCAATETGSLPDLFPRFGLPTELPRKGGLNGSTAIDDAILLAVLGGINELVLQHLLGRGAVSLPELAPTGGSAARPVFPTSSAGEVQGRRRAPLVQLAIAAHRVAGVQHLHVDSAPLELLEHGRRGLEAAVRLGAKDELSGSSASTSRRSSSASECPSRRHQFGTTRPGSTIRSRSCSSPSTTMRPKL